LAADEAVVFLQFQVAGFVAVDFGLARHMEGILRDTPRFSRGPSSVQGGRVLAVGIFRLRWCFAFAKHHLAQDDK
jgi:hypothetical protein